MRSWVDLNPAWQTAYEEAWRSFRLGNFGVGAVLVDADQQIVSTGHNTVAMVESDLPLHGNYMAHAEMNMFARMPTHLARGLHLLTTLEPCLMCAATAIFLDVATVAYAAADEYFTDLDAIWQHHPYTRERHRPPETPIGGVLADFARLLPLVHTLDVYADGKAAEVARAMRPELAAMADDAEFVARLRSIGAVENAVGLVGDRLASCYGGSG